MHKLLTFIFFILLILPLGTFAKEKTVFLGCVGKNSDMNDKLYDASHTYELRWLDTHYQLYYKEYDLKCTHTKTKIECKKPYHLDYDYRVLIDRINGKIQHYNTDYPYGKDDFLFNGFCKIKDKTMF